MTPPTHNHPFHSHQSINCTHVCAVSAILQQDKASKRVSLNSFTFSSVTFECRARFWTRFVHFCHDRCNHLLSLPVNQDIFCWYCQSSPVFQRHYSNDIQLQTETHWLTSKLHNKRYDVLKVLLHFGKLLTSINCCCSFVLVQTRSSETDSRTPYWVRPDPQTVDSYLMTCYQCVNTCNTSTTITESWSDCTSATQALKNAGDPFQFSSHFLSMQIGLLSPYNMI